MSGVLLYYLRAPLEAGVFFFQRFSLFKHGSKLLFLIDSLLYMLSSYIYQPFTDEAQTALFKDPVRTAL